MTDHLELSIMKGMRAISSSAEMSRRNVRHCLLAVEQGFVHVDVENIGPARRPDRERR